MHNRFKSYMSHSKTPEVFGSQLLPFTTQTFQFQVGPTKLNTQPKPNKISSRLVWCIFVFPKNTIVLTLCPYMQIVKALCNAMWCSFFLRLLDHQTKIIYFSHHHHSFFFSFFLSFHKINLLLIITILFFLKVIYLYLIIIIIFLVA